MSLKNVLILLAVLGGSFLRGAHAQDPESLFHKAYYLEKEKGSPAEAIPLYEEVVKSPAASRELKERAEKRLSLLRERIRSSDLSKLMPPDVLAYLEVRSPGEHLARLLKLGGFLEPGGAAGSEAAAAPPRPPFAVSPRLLEALREVDSAALAITEVDPRGPPRGVLIIHSGRSDLVQGLIETALSGAAASEALHPEDPVEGHPAYGSPLGTVVTTKELVIAANPRELAVEVVRRLGSDTRPDARPDARPSLGALPAFEGLKERRSGSLAFAFLNGPRAVELARAAISHGGQMPEEYLMLQAVADVESLEWAALDLGTREKGLGARLSLRLREDNHSLAFHLLRTPALGREALKAVPGGAALALGVGLGEPGGAPSSDREAGRAARAASQVTGLDLGREVFQNARAVLAYVLPGSTAVDPENGSLPIPDLGIIFLVKDPARSEALWRELLRVPATILQADPAPARTEEVEGQEVKVHVFPHSFQVYLASLPSSVVLATSKKAIAEALKTARGGGSILEDPGLAAPLGRLEKEASKLLVVHGGRAFSLVKPFSGMRPAESELVSEVLERATLSLSSRETPTGLDLGVEIEAPGLGPVIQRLMQMQGNGRRAEAAPRRRSRDRAGNRVRQESSETAPIAPPGR